MKQIIAQYTGKDITDLKTRAYKLDNNTIFAYLPGPGGFMVHLLPVPEILKIDTAWGNVKFQSYRKTTTGPVYLEVVQHD